ncbi:MAG: 2,3-bisphosphoglycerate-independent phosphoglycerate mutase [Oscillospiraceae bacterium]|nr:2,3-bisphosphoglycerate-independent phosphoglycerate mutase [Oscillospiraceae bacterium]
MKYVLVIGDGMADEPIQMLKNKTPLQQAKTPVLDELAKKGKVGSVTTVPEDVPAGSDTAILSIFGCDPRTCYAGRAPLEAAANDIEMNPGDVAFRCNLVSLDDSPFWISLRTLESHNAGNITPEESDALIEWLFYDSEFAGLAYRDGMVVHPGHSFRHIVVMEQGADKIKDLKLAQPHNHLGEKLDTLMPSGNAFSERLKTMLSSAAEQLAKHPINMKRRAEGKLPANAIWFWAAGTAVELPKFKDMYGMDGAVVSAVPICRGIGTLLGLERVDVEGATGDINTNYDGKADAALEQLKKYDFVAVHIDAPDECSHEGDLFGKMEAIEHIDGVVKRLKEGLDASGEDYRILVLSDHKTLLENRAHAGGDVPYLLYDSRVDTGAGKPFDEVSGAQGEHIGDATKLMSILFEQ